MTLTARLFEHLGLLSGLNDTSEIETGDELADLICMSASSLLDQFSDHLAKSSVPVMEPGHFGKRIYNSTYWDLSPSESLPTTFATT